MKTVRISSRFGRAAMFAAAMLALTGAARWGVTFAPYQTQQPGAIDRDAVYQVSTINALLQGLYDGFITFGELKQHGGFGLGTIQAADGEVMGIDGVYYQVTSDGVAHVIPDDRVTPFAAVTFFEPDLSFTLDGVESFAGLEKKIDEHLPTTNIFYAIKISGVFDYVRARSVPGQQKPYPPLTEVVKHQSEFEFDGAEGVMIGWRCPSYVKDLNVPGYHLHFLTAARDRGGHVLDARMNGVRVEIDFTLGFEMILPQSDEFYQASLAGDGLDEVERGKSTIRWYREYH
ncbi:MAG: acetolactate decarboxylase [bacterium]|nr:acetolactate decarboxylase [bacterium]